MERDAVKKLLMINLSIFPQFYNKLSDRELALQINVWHDLFKDSDGAQVEAAFRQALANAQYPVKPADVFAIINAQAQANLPTADELFAIADNAAQSIAQYYSRERGWEQIWGATKSGYQSALEIYQGLPAILREWRHSPMDLLKWWWTITDDNESYIRREFEQAIKDLLNRRATLGIEFGAEFHPEFEKMTGCMKPIELGEPKKVAVKIGNEIKQITIKKE